MTTDVSQRRKPAPLTAQVTQAEQRLLDRHQMVDYRASRLRDNLRKQLSSPAMLLVAGAIGFAAGTLKKRQTSSPNNEGASHGKWLRVALKLMSLATALFRLRPSAGTDSSSGLGWPIQVPEARHPAAASFGQAG
jgi:hypothetical protein